MSCNQNGFNKRLTSRSLNLPSLVDVSIPDISLLTYGIVSTFCGRKNRTPLDRPFEGFPHLFCNLALKLFHNIKLDIKISKWQSTVKGINAKTEEFVL